ncbi:hypothetical protein LC065_12510 [Halobacillus litoralis]|uniref:hypothetical protein n=1 Tax=Halobacillus litoralis TaxID=45668 RepID=UPI00273EBD03|nr:hypothetical protein [Halobacillus litoralis]WLR46400.1 hypothetical protein LC065_12510 [Halobacillus litoralis]
MKSSKKRLYTHLILLFILLMTVGCQDIEGKETTLTTSDDESGVDQQTETESTINESDQAKSTEEKGASSKGSGEDDSNAATSSDENSKQPPEEKMVDLSSYTSSEIEWARVWHQLAPNQQIDTMYVKKIPAGSLINPNHEESAVYPEDVIQLEGTRLVDGAVTYSGNGDGTVNVYNVPARWNEKLTGEVDKEEIKEVTEDVIKSTKQVKIEPFSNEDIVELIKKIQTVHPGQ